MNNKFLPNIVLFVAAFALSNLPGIGFLDSAYAVVPPPDGGYPNFTTAEGTNALQHLTTGVGNTAAGWRSLFTTSEGSLNTAVGAGTLVINSTGSHNTANGALALLLNTTGNFNTAVGDSALYNNSEGFGNTATGVNALQNNITGILNTAIGNSALAVNSHGGSNTAVGTGALGASTSGSGNTALGQGSGTGVTTAGGVTCIGAGVAGGNLDNTTWIGNVFGVTTLSGTTAPVIVSNEGQLGTVVSSERFKKDIAPMDKTSEAILSLRPVTFHYKTDTKGAPQFGLIAEEVAKVNPGLVLLDKEGKPFTVRYDAVNAMLLNEFLKEHDAFVEEQRRVQEQECRLQKQETTIARQQEQIEALTAGLQKVSAQVATSAPSLADSR
jgi:Chaperone of endosialidase